MFLIHAFKKWCKRQQSIQLLGPSQYVVKYTVLCFFLLLIKRRGWKKRKRTVRFVTVCTGPNFDLIFVIYYYYYYIHTPRHKNILTHKSLNAFSVKIETRNMYRHKQLMGWYIASSQQYADLYSSVHTHIKVNYA